MLSLRRFAAKINFIIFIRFDLYIRVVLFVDELNLLGIQIRLVTLSCSSFHTLTSPRNFEMNGNLNDFNRQIVRKCKTIKNTITLTM